MHYLTLAAALARSSQSAWDNFSKRAKAAIVVEKP